MDLKLVVKLSGPHNNVPGYVRFANVLLEECASNPRLKEFVEDNEVVSVNVEGFEPVALRGYYMNSSRNKFVDPDDTRRALAEDLKETSKPAH